MKSTIKTLKKQYADDLKRLEQEFIERKRKLRKGLEDKIYGVKQEVFYISLFYIYFILNSLNNKSMQ